MSEEFESNFESEERKKDALDKLRTETNRYLRKYARRIKTLGEDRVKAQFSLDPDSDPEVVADEALEFASKGQFLLSSGKQE